MALKGKYFPHPSLSFVKLRKIKTGIYRLLYSMPFFLKANNEENETGKKYIVHGFRRYFHSF